MRYAALTDNSPDLLQGRRSRHTTVLGAHPRFTFSGSLPLKPPPGPPSQTRPGHQLFRSPPPRVTARLAG